MMNFEGIEAKGGFVEPEAKGYAVKIVSVIPETSKAGKPMIRFEVDIADGPCKGCFGKYPKRLYQVYADTEGKQRLKRIFMDIIADNKPLFPGDPFEGGFDEQSVVGCIVGGVFKWGDSGYLDLNYICPVERALKVEAKPKPEVKPAVSDTPDANGDLF